MGGEQPPSIRERQAQSDKLIASGSYRSDGSPKGTGYFGEIEMEGGMKLSEVSVNTEIDGYGEMEVPSVVPTLTKEELQWLADGNNVAKKFREDRHPIAVSIIRKASAHAKKRLRAGKSVWWEEGEEVTPLPK